MTNRDKIIDRIRKLMALGQNASANQHEAELAMQRANDLMKEHQLSMSEVAVDEAKNQEVKVEYYSVNGLKMKYHWVVVLGWAAAKLYDCEVLNSPTLHGTTVIFIGFEDDIQMAKATFDHLWFSWNGFIEGDLREAKNRAKAEGRRWAPRDTMKFKLGHGQGYAHTLLGRASRLQKERQEEVKASSTTGTQLVVVRNQMVKQRFQKLSGGKSGQQAAGAAAGYNAGKKAGESVALGGSVSNSTRLIGR